MMLKFKRVPALILIAVLLLPLFSASALAGQTSNKESVSKPLFNCTSDTGIYETPDGPVFKAWVYYAFSSDYETISKAFEEYGPALYFWKYIGDSFVFEDISMSGRGLEEHNGFLCDEFVYSLEDFDGLCVELIYGDNIWSYSEDWSLDGWRPVHFQDVHRGAWYYEDVRYSSNVLGLIGGKGDRIFAPDDSISYAEAIALAVRARERSYRPGMLFFPEPAAGEKWYQPYLDYAKIHGIPWSYPDYNASATRAEVVRLFFAALSHQSDLYYKPMNRVRDGAIPDVPATHQYADEIYTLYRAGILSGSDTACSFRPDTSIKRSEVAAILTRIFGDYKMVFSLS